MFLEQSHPGTHLMQQYSDLCFQNNIQNELLKQKKNQPPYNSHGEFWLLVLELVM